MGRHKGFVHEALADISLIRNSLRDQYHKGFPLLKELVQNADDAKASVLHLGWAHGVPGASHELLRHPGVFAINDGGLGDQDERGIRTLGLSTKGAESDTIGKFGLGLKSVFHLCEVFYYVAAPDRPGPEFRTGDVLNPWSGKDGDLVNPSWDEVSPADLTALSRFASKRMGPEVDWLCFWFPLRRRPKGDHYPIVDFFPLEDDGVEAIFPRDLDHQLARITPLLRRLQRIVLWAPAAAASDQLRKRGVIELEADCERMVLSEDGARAANSERAFTGDVVVANEGRERRIQFVGHERRLKSRTLQQLRRRPDWPKIAVIDRHTRRSEQREEKAVPHSAVVLSLTEAPPGSGQLRIRPAVFLPVGDDPLETHSLEVDADVVLDLHGYFFLDAGRQGLVEGGTATRSESSVAAAWNHELKTKGTLRLILPAVESLVRRTPAVALGLSAAIRESRLFERHRDSICAEHQWIFVLADDGPEWTLLPAATHVYGVPEPSGSCLLEDLLPKLKELRAELTITHTNWPWLRADELRPWPPRALARLLDVSEKGFDHDEACSYLFRLLEENIESLDSDRTRAALLRLLVVVLPLGLSGQKGAQELLGFLLEQSPPEAVFYVQRSSQSSSELWSFFTEWPSQPKAPVLVPSFLRPASHDKAASGRTLSPDQAESLILGLERMSRRFPRSPLITDFACQIVKACTNRSKLLEQIASLRVFSLRGEASRRSHAELSDLAERGMLLADSEEGLTGDLTRALNERLYLVDYQLTEAVFPSLIKCTAPGVCKFLAERSPALAAPTERKPLFSRLLQHCRLDNPRERRAIRYLLHGVAEKAPLGWLYVGGKTGAPWIRLASLALTSAGEEWRLLPGELSGSLSGDQDEALKIKLLTPRGAMDLVKEVGPNLVNGSALTQTERWSLLRDCPVDREAELRELRIHEDCEGELVPLTEHTFLPEGFELDDPALRKRAVILSVPGDPDAEARLSRLVRPLGPSNAIDLACRSGDPSSHWRTILTAIEASRRTQQAFPKTFNEEVLWLPTRQGQPINHRSLLHVAGLEDLLSRALEGSTDWYCLDDLPAEVREHESFVAAIGVLFPAPQTARTLQRLGAAMGERDDCALGALELDASELPALIAAFSGAPESVLPHWTLFHEVEVRHPESLAAVIEPLQNPLSTDSMVAKLDFLTGAHCRAPERKKSELLRWYLRYLQVAVAQEVLPVVLPRIRLLNQADEWRNANELCFVDADLDRRDLLDLEFARVLGIEDSRLSPERTQSANGGLLRDSEKRERVAARRWNTAGRVLREYFNPWERVLPPQAIGAFVSLLGDEPGVRGYAESLLEPESRVMVIRTRLEWSDPVLGHFIPGAGLSADELLGDQLYVVEVFSGDTVRVDNLLGQPIEARVSQESPKLVMEASHLGRAEDRTVWRLLLRPIPVQEHSPGQGTELILEAARLVLDRVAYRSVPNLEEIWEDACRSAQLSLPVAQNLVLSAAPFYLRNQLGCRDLGRVSGILARWDKARRLEAEAEQTEGPAGRKLAERATAELRGARDELRLLLDSGNDPDAEQKILEAVRDKVRQFEYRPESTPFELLQNADDAAGEWKEMVDPGSPALDELEQVVFVKEPTRLLFMHWGRPINKSRHGERVNADRGYERDLEKMLVLSASDKALVPGKEARIGKFGLGFKSVFLLSQRPAIVSDRLGFSVEAGFYPRQLSDEVNAELKRCLHREGGEHGTVVALDLVEAELGDRVIHALSQHLDIALLFSKHLRRCRVVFADGSGRDDSEGLSREELPLPALPDAALARLRPASGCTRPPQYVLALRGEQGAMLLGLGRRSFVALPREVPTVWVGAPTSVKLEVGLAINGPFDLHVGRLQLASDSPQNLLRAERLGSQSRAQLEALFVRLCTSWGELRTELGLDREATEYEFWNSLFKLFLKIPVGEFAAPGLELLQKLLWSTDGTMQSFLAQEGALPTGLPGAQGVLTSAKRITWVPAGGLALRDVCEEVCAWDWFNQTFPPGQGLDRGVWLQLKKAGAVARSLREVALADVLGQRVEGEGFSPDEAHELGQWLDRDLLVKLEVQREAKEQEARPALSRARFRNEAGKWSFSGELVAPWATSEEALCADFTPMSRLLSADYTTPASQRLFLACRRRDELRASDIGVWALAASSPSAQKAVLTYLLRGRQHYEVGQRLAAAIARGSGGWLADLSELATFKALPEEARSALRGLLFPQQEPWPEEEQAPPPAPPRDLRKVMSGVWDWWQGCRTEQVARYERRVYGTLRPNIEPDGELTDPQVRKDWFVLLALGSLHRMGLTRTPQHRGFLQHCVEQGWMKTFTARDRDLAAWGQLLEDYFSDKVQDTPYHRWVEGLPNLYQISRWLEDYAEAFLNTDRIRDPFRLEDITVQRASVLLQGSTFNAPPLRRTLGRGAPFVMRELCRWGVVKNPLAYPLCYVPVKRLRNLLWTLGEPLSEGSPGQQSRQIHELLVDLMGPEKAIFLGDFDLPLLALAEDRQLQEDLLHCELSENEESEFDDEDELDDMEEDE